MKTKASGGLCMAAREIVREGNAMLRGTESG